MSYQIAYTWICLLYKFSPIFIPSPFNTEYFTFYASLLISNYISCLLCVLLLCILFYYYALLYLPLSLIIKISLPLYSLFLKHLNSLSLYTSFQLSLIYWYSPNKLKQSTNSSWVLLFTILS